MSKMTANLKCTKNMKRIKGTYYIVLNETHLFIQGGTDANGLQWFNLWYSICEHKQLV